MLHKIAAFNKAPQPNLTIEDFRLLESQALSETSVGSDEPLNGPINQTLTTKQQGKVVVKRFISNFKHLKGFFATKRMIWLSVVLWIAYVSLVLHSPTETSLTNSLLHADVAFLGATPSHFSLSAVFLIVPSPQSFSIAGGFLPLILRQKGVDTSASLDTTYRNYVIVVSPSCVSSFPEAYLDAKTLYSIFLE